MFKASIIAICCSFFFSMVEGHFLFAEYIPTIQKKTKTIKNEVRVTFHEPGSEPSIKFIKGRLDNMMLYFSINNNNQDPPILELNQLVYLKENDRGTAMILNGTTNYLEDIMDSSISLNNNAEVMITPTFLTGYLDYGPFRELDPPPDLQYTYSAQNYIIFPNNNNNEIIDYEYYWNSYYKNDLVEMLALQSSTLMTIIDESMNNNDDNKYEDGKFRIAFRNYGSSPYEVLIYTTQQFLQEQPDRNMTICVYVADDGTNMGCITQPLQDNKSSTTANTFLITLNWDATASLEESESYLVLANTSDTSTITIMNEDDDTNIPIETVISTIYYSSTSFTMASKNKKNKSLSSSWGLQNTNNGSMLLIVGATITGMVLLTIGYCVVFYINKTKTTKTTNNNLYNSVLVDENDDDIFNDAYSDDDFDDDFRDDGFELSDYHNDDDVPITKNE